MLNVNIDFIKSDTTDKSNVDFIKTKDVKVPVIPVDTIPTVQPVLATGVKATTDDIILALQKLNLVTQK
jgi:hypothetical protein